MQSLSRRDVLRTAALGGLISATRPLLADSPDSSGQPAESPEKPAENRADGLLLTVGIPAIFHARSLQSASAINVVLSNLTHKPIRFWSVSCSWGYANLSLEFKDAGGHEWQATKTPRPWYRNVPSTHQLADGESAVFAIKLSTELWQNLPVWKEHAGQTMQMRVRFDVPEEDQARKHAVWTGALRTVFSSYQVTQA